MNIMKSVIFCGAVLGCFVLKTTYAAITEWTTPVIATANGTATIILAEGAALPTLVAITGADNFVITSETPAGVITVTAGTRALAGTLDYETNTEHVLVVEADDSGATTGTATITITVTDVNDNAPAFPAAGYSTCVADATAAAATVLTLTTTDVDTTTADNVISAMTITDGNTNTDFAVSTAGVITTAKDLDKSTTAGYALVVEAADSNSGTKLTGATTGFITVSDSCGCCGAVMLAASLGVTLLFGLVTSLV